MSAGQSSIGSWRGSSSAAGMRTVRTAALGVVVLVPMGVRRTAGVRRTTGVRDGVRRSPGAGLDKGSGNAGGLLSLEGDTRRGRLGGRPTGGWEGYPTLRGCGEVGTEWVQIASHFASRAPGSQPDPQPRDCWAIAGGTPKHVRGPFPTNPWNRLSFSFRVAAPWSRWCQRLSLAVGPRAYPPLDCEGVQLHARIGCCKRGVDHSVWRTESGLRACYRTNPSFLRIGHFCASKKTIIRTIIKIFAQHPKT